MRNSLFSKIAWGVMIGVSALGSCTTNNYPRELERAKKILKVKDMASVDRHLGNEYFSSIFGGLDLRSAAAMLAGTYKAGEAFFSQAFQQEYLDIACKEADKNRDRVVTTQEASDYLVEVHETATQNWINR
jgi:hypothetical protein